MREQRRRIPTPHGLADRAHWTRVARQWIAWAQARDGDAFWAYRQSLRAFIGRGTGTALDVGCGEGRISRELRSLGFRVTASDVVPEMLGAAQQAGSAHEYVIADIAALPFRHENFDLVMAYNVLMDVVDVPRSIREIRRVLRPAGQVLISLVHPFSDRGRFLGAESDPEFVVSGTYFGRQRFEETEEQGGMRMEFAGWSQPLEAYAAALEQAGLAITAIREPVPERHEKWQRLRNWQRIPLFLWMKARPIA